MFNKIDSIIKNIKNTEQYILFKIHKMIKSESMNYPVHLEMYRFEQIDAETAKLV